MRQTPVGFFHSRLRVRVRPVSPVIVRGPLASPLPSAVISRDMSTSPEPSTFSRRGWQCALTVAVNHFNNLGLPVRRGRKPRGSRIDTSIEHGHLDVPAVILGMLGKELRRLCFLVRELASGGRRLTYFGTIPSRGNGVAAGEATVVIVLADAPACSPLARTVSGISRRSARCIRCSDQERWEVGCDVCVRFDRRARGEEAREMGERD